MKTNKILYVCEPCQEGAPENCGHGDPKKLRIITVHAGALWMCRDCLDFAELSDFPDGVKPQWDDLRSPPEYSPVGDELKAFHEAWTASEIADAVGDFKLKRQKQIVLHAINTSINRMRGDS